MDEPNVDLSVLHVSERLLRAFVHDRMGAEGESVPAALAALGGIALALLEERAWVREQLLRLEAEFGGLIAKMEDALGGEFYDTETGRPAPEVLRHGRPARRLRVVEGHDEGGRRAD